jgi:hypothetical protein
MLLARDCSPARWAAGMHSFPVLHCWTSLVRFLLGLEVPVKFFELARFHENNKLRNESLQLLGPWRINGDVKYVLVSCERFWVRQDRKPHTPGKVKYRLRTSIINKLLHHYSVWTSRPGIVEFR